MLVVCAGTATEVGKTWVGAQALTALRGRGAPVSARKPLQSFDPADSHPTDAEVLAGATGEPATIVCPPERSFPIAMAPPMAAHALARACPTIAELAALVDGGRDGGAIRWVESVGGVRSPLAADGDTVDLCSALKPDVVVLVADAGLGTINSVRMSVAALAGWPVQAFLNRFDPADQLHQANWRWLRDRDQIPVATSVAGLLDQLDDVEHR